MSWAAQILEERWEDTSPLERINDLDIGAKERWELWKWVQQYGGPETS